MGAFQQPAASQHDGAGMAHGVGIGLTHEFDIVTSTGQPVDYGLVESRLQPQIALLLTPGAAKQPTWAVDGLPEGLPELNESAEQCGLGLRLTIAPHRSVSHRSAIVEQRERRIKRVEGLPTGLEEICRGGVE